MHRTPSPLSEQARTVVVRTLNAVLADGLDLHSQIKVAHWNVKGPHFASLHPLFETFAITLAGFTDVVAERAVTLGGQAYGTARHVAAVSKIAEYPAEASRDLEHVKLLAERFVTFLEGVQSARTIAEEQADTDTVDILTGIVTEFEKNAWFLQASMA